MKPTPLLALGLTLLGCERERPPQREVPKTVRAALARDAGLSAASEKEGAEYPVAWSEELGLRSLSDIDKRLSAEESAGLCELAKGDQQVVAKSRQQWSKLRADGFEPSSTIEETGDSAALVFCGTLQRLRSAAPASRSFVRDLKFDSSLVALLPASFATQVSDARQEEIASAERAGRSLESVTPRRKVLPAQTRVRYRSKRATAPAPSRCRPKPGATSIAMVSTTCSSRS